MKKQFLTFLLFTLTALLGLGISVSAQSKCAVGDEDCKIDEASDKIANDPSDQEAYYLRGKAYYRKGDYDSALLDFDRYIALRPASTITTIRPQLRPCSSPMPAATASTPITRCTQPQTV